MKEMLMPFRNQRVNGGYLFNGRVYRYSDRDVERRASEAEVSFAKQLRTVREKASTKCLEVERRLKEEVELAQRLSGRNTNLQVIKNGAAGEYLGVGIVGKDVS